MDIYTCGTCGSHTLKIRGWKDGDYDYGWELSCGNGHILEPVDGLELTING